MPFICTHAAVFLRQVILNFSLVCFFSHSHGFHFCLQKDKLVYKMHLAFQILIQSNQITSAELDFVLRFPYLPNLHSPFDFLPQHLWGGVKALSNIDAFCGLDRDFDISLKRWKKYIESEAPEMEKLPGEWKNKTPMQKLCILRTLRPDRMTYAASCFVAETMGEQYVGMRTIPFVDSYMESCASTPLFFILSPGVDPLQDVEKLGKSMNISADYHNFHNISLGQGQERLAEAAIEVGIENGHWVVLQNIHLVTKWLPHLEKFIEESMESAHTDFRLFVSAEAAPSPNFHAIPQGILEASIKITNESPTGIKANLHRALDNFTQEMLVSLNRIDFDCYSAATKYSNITGQFYFYFCFIFSLFRCRNFARRKVNSKRFYFHCVIFMRVYVNGANSVRKVGISNIHSASVI